MAYCVIYKSVTVSSSFITFSAVNLLTANYNSCTQTEIIAKLVPK